MRMTPVASRRLKRSRTARTTRSRRLPTCMRALQLGRRSAPSGKPPATSGATATGATAGRAQYGNEVKNVQSYKRNVENKEHEKFTKLLEKYTSKDKNEKPYVFYFAPVNQDIDRMRDDNYKQCTYTYYQTTMGSSGHIYRCSSIATPSFDYGILGSQPETVEEFKEMIRESHDPKFNCQTCINSTARCNRIALEINTEWNKEVYPNNKIAIEEPTNYVGPKNKALGKHIYSNIEKRWDKSTHTNMIKEQKKTNEMTKV